MRGGDLGSFPLGNLFLKPKEHLTLYLELVTTTALQEPGPLFTDGWFFAASFLLILGFQR